MPRGSLFAIAVLAACPGGRITAPVITSLNRTTHDPHFPVATGVHAQSDCNDCHGSFDTFTQFSCTTSSCRLQAKTDPTHAGVAGYVYESSACFTCHPRGSASSVDHTKLFPIAPADKHAGIACSDCHTDPAVRATTTCNLCHSHPVPDIGARHGSVNDYDMATGECLRCHADAQVNAVAAHLPFQISAGNPHRWIGCLQCHPLSRSDKPYGADFGLQTVNCLSCHGQSQMNDTHQEISGYQYRSQSCIQGGCHANGRKPGD